MTIHEELRIISTEQLLDVMESDFETPRRSEDYEDHMDYLKNAYPNIFEFIVRTVSDGLPFESEEQADFFLGGAVYATVALCRNAEILGLRNSLS